MEHMLSGCDMCRNSALVGMAAPLQKIGTADGPTGVYRCGSCDTFWEENLREAHPITKSEAIQLCPELA